MRDLRRAPFCWQGVDATAAIRRRWEGKQRTSALALYQAMTEVANEQRGDRFRVSRRQLGARAGMTARTVDTYAEGFEELGLLRRHRQKQGRENLANTWELLGGVAHPDDGGGAAKSTTPGAANSTATDQAETVEAKQKASAVADDPEVTRLCELMGRLSAERSGNPKYLKSATSEAWQVAMDRLLRIDGRSPAMVERAINWVHRHPFWGANVLSVPKLREQFDRLLLQARGAGQNGSSGGQANIQRDGADYDSTIEHASRAGD